MLEHALRRRLAAGLGPIIVFCAPGVLAQETDRVSTPNAAGAGMAKGIVDQLGDGRGSVNTPGSSLFIIARDPARAVRRGRNLFQRKFKVSEGQGPRTNDGTGDIATTGIIGAGLADSCAACHGRPRGSAGVGGDVFTRPDSRDAPHLFGLGLQEQLADEITTELRAIRDAAIEDALNGGDGAPLTPAQARILGANSIADWSLNTGGSIVASTNTTEGTGSVALRTSGSWTEINSAVLGALDVATAVQYDFFIPVMPPWGELSVVLIAPSIGMWWNELGPRVQLSQLTAGQFNTVSFAIPQATRAALASATDIRLKIIVNAPNVGTATTRYVFDNIRMTEAPGGPVTADLISKGVNYGSITVAQNGVVDTSNVQGVNPDLRVRPFFAEGTTVSIREFAVGAFNAEMGIQITDPDIDTAAAGGLVVTPGGMVLDGSLDSFESSPLPETTDPNANEPTAPGLPPDAGVALIDFMEIYLLNYFKPGHYEETPESLLGRATFNQIGCNSCHIANFTIDSDRRVADVETAFDPVNGVFNRLFATAAGRFEAVPDTTEGGFPTQPFVLPAGDPFVVEDIFTDFKRHDLGNGLRERNFDNTIHSAFMTEPLWGVGTTAPYGHDGRSINLKEVILRHGGEAAASRAAYVALSPEAQGWINDFLNTLVLFPPDDTASNLNVAGDIDPANPDFPQRAHGNIRLPTLFQIAGEGAE